MIDPKIARNYASCLFKNIASDKDHEIILNQISFLNEITTNSDLIRFTFCAQVVSKSDKLKLLTYLSKKFTLKKIVTQFFSVIIKNSRFNILPYIVKEYNKLLTTARGIKSVIVESANKPTIKELEDIKQYLENKLKKVINIEIHHRKELIGGVVIKHDSLMYDYSILGALERITQATKKTSFN